MSGQHTPGPWRAGNGTVLADSEKGLTVSGAFGKEAFDYYGGYLIGESISRANAERIVACVNACRDLDDEALADDAVVKTREDRNNLLESLKLAKDQLRELHESILAGWPEYGGGVLDITVRGTIAKLKGVGLP